MKKTLSSPLVAAANNIVSLGSRSNSLPRFQRDFNSFSRFLEVENRSLEKLKLPDKKKIRALASLNIASNFGRPGNLLGSLFSGALDLAGFVGNMFPGRGKFGKPQRPPKIKPPKPTIKGPKLKLGGMRAVGVGNALFAGLDFATGLAEGESVGKSAAGAGGALAGSLLGGAIGQALIPIPGLGFVVGSMAGSFLGGYAADRVYEGGSSLKQKLAERLKGQEGKQKGIASGLTFKDTIDKFDAAVNRFEKGVVMGLFGSVSQQMEESQVGDWEQGETKNDKVDYRPKDAQEFVPTGTGEEVFPLLGGRPTFTTGAGTFNAPRDGGARRHSAQDIGIDPNTPVVASRSGTVLQSYSSGYGSVGGAVVIKYDNGQQGLYGHTIPNVKVGDKVKAGQKIAKVVNDGGNTHLHYMRKDTRGNYIDPLPILQSSKSGVQTVQPKKEENKKDLQKQSQFTKDGADQSQKETQVSPQQQQATQAPTPQSQVAASPQMMQVPQMSSMVAAAPMNLPVAPQNIQYYTSYNQPGGGASVIMPIMMGGGGGGQQRPVFIPVGGGGGGGTVIMPGPTEGQVVNSLMKTMLLTNLSST
jgi:murein DD-endopeptidase MepM/ murein hydrolase activator NlpD